jgi:hypothetical protein
MYLVDVWLVLMVGADDLNLHALSGSAEILKCHARRDQRAPAAQVGIGARHVVQDADPDGAVGVLRRKAHPPQTRIDRGQPRLP